MTKEKSHARDPSKKQTSIAIPGVLLDAIQNMADQELRTRNNMIEVLLREAVEEKKHLLAAEEHERYKTRNEK